jgi:hypothetical protein
MKGFTALSTAKNPKEYTRQYVDEVGEDTDVVGYSPSLEFALDQWLADESQKPIIDIIDGELTGDDAKVSIVTVDLSTDAPHTAVQRKYVVVAGTEGDGLDAYTYAGTLKAVAGTRVVGTATSTDEFVSDCTFVPPVG